MRNLSYDKLSKTNFNFKYIKQLVLIFILSFCIHISLTAQETIQKSDYGYLHQGQDYEYQDMGNIFSQHEGAYIHFVKATKKLKTAKTWRVVSLSSLGFSAILFATDINTDKGDVAYKSVFGVLLIGFVALPSGIISLITSELGRKNKRLSVDLFNQAYSVNLPKANPIELSLVVKNGLGLQLKF